MREPWTERSKGKMSEVFADCELNAPFISGFGSGTFGEENRVVYLVSFEGKGFQGTKDKIVLFFEDVDSVESMIESLKKSVEEHKNGR